MDAELILADIVRARYLIESMASELSIDIRKTPIIETSILRNKNFAPILLKLENLQTTGSFKIRGAINKISQLRKNNKNLRGVLTVSSGNFGLAVAYVARKCGMESLIIVPKGAPKSKKAAIRNYGGIPKEVSYTSVEALLMQIDNLCNEKNLVFIHSLQDPHVMAGQGTVGLDIYNEIPDVETVLVPVGSGCLIAGVATALKSLNPKIRIIGVGPEKASVYIKSFHKKEPQVIENLPETISDCLRAPFISEFTLAQGLRFVDEVVEVTEKETKQMVRDLWVNHRLIVEPGSCVTLAAIHANKILLQEKEKTVCIITGGNFDLDKAIKIFEEK